MRVQFKETVKVHYMFVWTFAYKTARQSPWTQIAVNRAHFKYKINNFYEPLLTPILRNKINHIHV